MGDVKGFLKVKRQAAKYRPACERVKDYSEVLVLRGDKDSEEQASRCMNCGTPFCHLGCPIGNYIPEWNDLLFNGHWERALQLLSATNNFPELTGRLCPALCEYSCVLGINDDPITIRENELDIIEYAFRNAIIRPNPPKRRTGKSIAVIGSGPAGLACADQLNKAGHLVVVFEKDKQPGGLLRYGIPDFKLEKRIVERRIEILKKEGIVFVNGMNVGVNYPLKKISKDFSCVCLAIGSRLPRDLKVEGRDLQGICSALDYLIQPNSISAKGKKVIVIGGGDTGADCVGTAHRQGAKCVVQIELLAEPPKCRTCEYPWPKYPLLYKTSTSHEEGGTREWSVSTKKFVGENGCVKKLICERIGESGGKEFEIGADLVILAMGFLHPEHNGLVKELDLALDNKGNVKTDDNYMTSSKGTFSCGDMHRGQSLIVWAISEGRRAAHCIDRYIMGASNLPIF